MVFVSLMVLLDKEVESRFQISLANSLPYFLEKKMGLSKKKSALLIAVAVILGLEMSKIYIPDGFERPYFYKCKVTMIKLSGLLVMIFFSFYFKKKTF
jgi:hypothetical protein